METQQNKKRYLVLKIVGALLLLSSFFLNTTLFVATGSAENSKSSLFLQASADGSESAGGLQWSALTACGGGRIGSYRVCNVNGLNGACTKDGDVSCTCGSDCS